MQQGTYATYEWLEEWQDNINDKNQIDGGFYHTALTCGTLKYI